MTVTFTFLSKGFAFIAHMLAIHHGNSVANSVVCTTAASGCFQAKMT